MTYRFPLTAFTKKLPWLLPLGKQIAAKLEPLIKRLLPPEQPPNTDETTGSGMDRVVARKRNWRRYAPLMAIGGVILIIASWLLFGFGGATYRTKADQLTIGTVTEGNFEDFAAVRGTIAPFTTVFLTTDQGGTVKQVLVEDGAEVKSGQPILILSNPTLQMQFATSQLNNAQQTANVQNTELQLEQSRFANQKELLDIQYQLKTLQEDIKRDQRLYEAGAIAHATYEKDKEKYIYQQKLLVATMASFKKSDSIRRQQLAQLKDTTAQLKTNLDTAREGIDGLTIRAPMDGQLSALDAQVGQSKAAGAVLGQVGSQNRFKLVAQVDEFYLGRIQIGQDALLTIDGQDYKARVQKIYPQVTDGTFKTDITFVGKAPTDVHTGQAVDVKLEMGGAQKAMLLPLGSFYQDTGGAWAFVLDHNGHTATKRPIKLGRRNPSYIEVVDGLKPGDRVIISSYEAYKTVDRVKIKTP